MLQAISDSESESLYLDSDEDEVTATLVHAVRREEDKTENKAHIRARLQELFGYEGKSVQVDVIHHLIYEKQDIILVAKTGFGKSLIFQAAPLIYRNTQRICLVIMPLKAIEEQQCTKLSSVEGAHPFVLNGDNNTMANRKAIASGIYTHG
jgi:superfamily II DNA helicase RecQ